jgi:hypothetical protein
MKFRTQRCQTVTYTVTKDTLFARQLKAHVSEWWSCSGTKFSDESFAFFESEARIPLKELRCFFHGLD